VLLGILIAEHFDALAEAPTVQPGPRDWKRLLTFAEPAEAELVQVSRVPGHAESEP
jgi:hypothetical protein